MMIEKGSGVREFLLWRRVREGVAFFLVGNAETDGSLWPGTRGAALAFGGAPASPLAGPAKILAHLCRTKISKYRASPAIAPPSSGPEFE